MKPILIVGAYGNMGSRYRAILKHMKVPYDCLEFDTWDNYDFSKPKLDYHSIIIATPTYTHYTLIKFFHKYKLPMLCEKPITTNKLELEEIIDMCPNLKMVCQYEYLVNKTGNKRIDSIKPVGPSYYNFFKTGKDGLSWDCISIVALSDGVADLANDSPIWRCQINGTELNIKDMDIAYCKMIRDWVNKPMGDLLFIRNAHDKIFSGVYNERDSHWNPS